MSYLKNYWKGDEMPKNIIGKNILRGKPIRRSKGPKRDYVKPLKQERSFLKIPRMKKEEWDSDSEHYPAAKIRQAIFDEDSKTFVRHEFEQKKIPCKETVYSGVEAIIVLHEETIFSLESGDFLDDNFCPDLRPGQCFRELGAYKYRDLVKRGYDFWDYDEEETKIRNRETKIRRDWLEKFFDDKGVKVKVKGRTFYLVGKGMEKTLENITNNKKVLGGLIKGGLSPTIGLRTLICY